MIAIHCAFRNNFTTCIFFIFLILSFWCLQNRKCLSFIILCGRTLFMIHNWRRVQQLAFYTSVIILNKNSLAIRYGIFKSQLSIESWTSFDRQFTIRYVNLLNKFKALFTRWSLSKFPWSNIYNLNSLLRIYFILKVFVL